MSPKPLGEDATMKQFTHKVEFGHNGISTIMTFEKNMQPLVSDVIVTLNGQPDSNQVVHRLPGVVKISRCRFLPVEVGDAAGDPTKWITCKPKFLLPDHLIDSTSLTDAQKIQRNMHVAMLQIKLKGAAIDEWQHPFPLYVRWISPPQDHGEEMMKSSITEEVGDMNNVD